MINPELHKKPLALDRTEHRHLKVRRETNILEAAAGLNAFFVTAAEFADACKEYPILFLRAGTDPEGKPLVAPLAIFGLTRGENLFYRNGVWDARYVPAMLRSYPFSMAHADEKRYVLCFDSSSPAISTEEGEPLFDAEGEPTPYMKSVQSFVEQIEIEVERTRLAGRRLMELGLLQDKRFDATLPDGTTVVVDGFLAVDEARMDKLTDAEVVQLHRNGLLGLLNLHVASLGNMRALLERRVAMNAKPA